jgi:hypothetical protein
MAGRGGCLPSVSRPASLSCPGWVSRGVLRRNPLPVVPGRSGNGGEWRGRGAERLPRARGSGEVTAPAGSRSPGRALGRSVPSCGWHPDRAWRGCRAFLRRSPRPGLARMPCLPAEGTPAGPGEDAVPSCGGRPGRAWRGCRAFLRRAPGRAWRGCRAFLRRASRSSMARMPCLPAECADRRRQFWPVKAIRKASVPRGLVRDACNIDEAVGAGGPLGGIRHVRFCCICICYRYLYDKTFI